MERIEQTEWDIGNVLILNEMSGLNGMNFHSSGMIWNVSEWGERQFHDVINCMSKLKAFVDGEVTVAMMVEIILEIIEDNNVNTGYQHFLLSLFSTLKEKALENIVEKQENAAGNQHFLLFPHFFPPFQKQISEFCYLIICKYFHFVKYMYFAILLTLSQILDSSKLKEFPDDDFKFKENGRKIFKRVENTAGKREIAL